jgi:ubiquinone/menaquinone biosynthesis C-methylase UbiE
MELQDASALIQHEGIAANGPAAWADLGCGSGLFTRALAGMLPPDSTIYAVDRVLTPLAHNNFPRGITVKHLQLDFVANELPFQNLDGVLMANSLHFVSDQQGFIRSMGRYLKAGGCFLVCEYDTDTANRWVPYPLSYHTLWRLFQKAGYTNIQRLHEQPSIYGRANIYSVLISR